MILLFLALLFPATPADAAVCTVNGAGGNWNVAGSWTSCGGGAPGASDSVNIDTGTITLTADASIDDVTLSGGTLNLDSYTLEASGAWTRSAGTFDAGTGTVTLNGSAAENITSGGQAFNNLTINSQGLETGLMGYWKLDETATGTCSGGKDACDSSGNGNHGTHMYNTTISTDVAPLSFTNDRSLSFDGVNDHVDVGTNLGITGELTVSAWVYPTQAPTGEGRTIINTYYYGGGTNQKGWTLGYLYGSVDRFDFGIYDSSGAGIWVVEYDFFANNLNTWTHVLGVYKPSTYGRLYVNGTMEREDTSSVPAAIAYHATTYLRIGTRADNFGQGEWKGLIDDVRVYNRALTTAEISLLAQGDQLGASTYTLQDALDVNGDLTLTAGELAAGANSITVGGSWLNTAGTFTAGTGTVTFDGTGTQTITSNSQSLYNMTVNKAAGTAQLSGALDLGGALTLSSGTFTPGADITVAGNFSQGGGTLNAGANSITVGGNWLNTAGTFTAGTGTVTLNGTGTQTITSNSQSLYNMTVNKAAGTAQLSGALDLGGALTLSSGTFTPGADITVAGNFSQGGGTLNAGANNITVGGSWLNTAGTFTAGTSTVTLNGTGTQTITSNSQSLYNMTVNKAAGTAQLSGALDLGGALTLSSGTFTPGADITVAGNFSQGGGTLNAGANSITVGGDWLNTAGTFTAGTGTVTLNGTGTQTITSNSQSLYNMTVNKAAGTAQLSGALDLGGALTLSSGTFTPGADITVAGNFSQGGGTLTAGANNIEVGGNWARSSGTFTAGTGTVSFTPNAAHSLSGDTTFYNFSLVEDDNAAGSSLTFAAGSTTTISNTWTLQGNAGDVITLASDDPGVTPWNVDPQATRTLAYLSVADSNNQDLLNVDCLDNCANGGANSYWNFGSSFGVYGTVYSDEGTTPLSTVTVQAALNGTDSGSSAVTGVDGVYRISDVAAIADGDAVTVYLEGGAQKAVTLTLGDGQSLAGVDLYQDRLIVRHKNAGPVTNTGIAAGIVADTDVTDIVDTSGTEITVKDGKELLVAAGYTLQLNDSFNTHDADIRGTLVDDGNTLEVSGSWAITGGAAYTATGTVRLTGTGSETITSNGKAFNALTLNDGLIGYWKFDETAADSCAGGEDSCDSSGFGYHGTHEGGPTVSTSVAPVAFTNNRSLSFNGTTDGVKVPAALDPGQNLTLAVWVYPTADGQSSRSHIMGRSRDSGCCMPTYGIRRASNNTIDFDTYAAAYNGLNSGDTVPNNQWTHIVVWKSGATKRIYINGVFMVEGTHSGTLASSTATEFFGQLHSTQSPDNRRFQGLIDDARVYNRALDAAEISLLGQGYQPGTAQGTYTLQDALDANGDLTQAAGELAAGANSITVGGDWLNYGGTFTAGTGAVTLNSATTAAVLSGGQAFYNLNFATGTFTLQDALSAAGVLTLTSGTLSQGASYNLTVSDTAATGTAISIANGAALSNTGTGDLTLGGGLVNEGTLTLQSSDTANNGIAVRSSSAGVQRTWSGAGTFNLRDVDIKDQAVDTSTYPIRTPSSTNSGNNSRFRFWGMISM